MNQRQLIGSLQIQDDLSLFVDRQVGHPNRVFDIVGVAVGVPVRITFFPIDVVHELMRSRVVGRDRRVVCRERIEHPRLWIDVDASVCRIPTRVGGLLPDQPTGFHVGLASVVAPMATHQGAAINHDDEHQERIDSVSGHQDLLGKLICDAGKAIQCLEYEEPNVHTGNVQPNSGDSMGCLD